jgi:hypothetical protein
VALVAQVARVRLEEFEKQEGGTTIYKG